MPKSQPLLIEYIMSKRFRVEKVGLLPSAYRTLKREVKLSKYQPSYLMNNENELALISFVGLN